MSGLEEISEDERVRIASDFVKSAPPGEFKEVVNDVRVLLANDKLLTRASSVFYEYATDQFTTVKVDGEDTLITKDGSLDGSKRFYDPNSSKSFTYNYLKNEASDIQEEDRDAGAEKWREAIQVALKPYLDEFFPAHVTAIYGKVEDDLVTITVCIEDHKYNPNNFWNGKWKSKWDVKFPTAGGYAKVEGTMSAQVHYYEDGNVQLLSNKNVEESIQLSSPNEGATNLVEYIKKSETEYQLAINENYNSMSNNTFKALRRNLPITQSLIDWHKLHGFQVGKDIMNKS